MKIHYSFYFLFSLVCITSCQSHRSSCDEVVCETVHRYGVPLEPDDWSARGQNGQVFSMRKDGVAVMRTYEEGILQGECTYSFPYRETVQKREIYGQGQLTQELVYDSNGLPWQQTSFISPKRQTVITWYESGAPKSHEELEGGLIVKGEYYNLQQQVESRVEDANGLRTYFDNQGQLKSIEQVQKGQLISSTSYHPCQTPAAITSYKNGQIEGQRRTYLTGGEPATIEEWKNNKQHGNTILFEQGEKVADVSYVNGYKQGIERRYRGEDTVAQEIHWVQGKKQGSCVNYFGTTSQTDWYFQDRKVPNRIVYEMLCNQ